MVASSTLMLAACSSLAYATSSRGEAEMQVDVLGLPLLDSKGYGSLTREG